MALVVAMLRVGKRGGALIKDKRGNIYISIFDTSCIYFLLETSILY